MVVDVQKEGMNVPSTKSLESATKQAEALVAEEPTDNTVIGKVTVRNCPAFWLSRPGLK